MVRKRSERANVSTERKSSRRGGRCRGKRHAARSLSSASAPSPVSSSSSSSSLTPSASSASSSSLFPSSSVTAMPQSPRQPHPSHQSYPSPSRRPPLLGRARQIPHTAPRPSLAPQVVPPWKLWDSVAIRLANVPKDANTFSLWHTFAKEGNISSIDLFEDFHGNRAHKGKLRFRFALPLPQLYLSSLLSNC